MKNNKKLLIPLFLASSFLLAGCSSGDVVARPSWMDESIISNVVTKDNTMKEIYDAIKAIGTTNSDILNKVLYDVALKQFGNYANDNETKGLATLNGYNLDAGTAEEKAAKYNDVEAFVNKYPFYKGQDTGYYKDGNNVKAHGLSREQQLKISLELIIETYKTIEDGVYEALYNEIKGGSYSLGNQKLFSEVSYINNLYKNMKTSKTAAQFKSTMNLNFANGYDSTTNPGHFTYRNNTTPWADYLECTYNGSKVRDGGFLTIKYDINGNPTTNIFESAIYGQHITNNLVKDVYRNLLIQKYVKEQRYATIGRSYAREINMISYTASSNEEYKNLSLVFNNYANTKIATGGNYNFEDLSKALKGYYTDETLLKGFLPQLELKINDKATTKKSVKYVSKIGKGTFNVYEGTKLASLVSDINKVMQDDDANSGNWATKRANPDTSIENTLTNNGAYTIEEGIKIKEREIEATNFIKDGWQTKTSVTELDDTNKERLFNLSTADIVDKPTKSYVETDYARYINNKAFLVDHTRASEQEPYKTIIISDNKTKLAICEIKNAISTSKASLTSDQNYAHILAGSSADDAHTSVIKMNSIVNGALKVTSNTDTYKKNANQYYLMISNIIFHDTAVYNYFKSQFPDLFK